MNKPALESVTLLDGTEVTVSDIPEDWWTVAKGSGYVRPDMLAPDPQQPRQYMDPERLAELQRSIAASGVRETLIVTPRKLAPWAKVEEKFKHCFFIIVSGHRRWYCTNLAGLPVIPIEVRIYKSRKEHNLDRSLLNKGRDDLTELDVGFEIVNLREDGWTIDELAAHFGMSTPQLYNRINLTQLHPDIQQLLLPTPGNRKKNALPVTTAGVLGGVKSPTPEELETLFENLGSVANGEDQKERERDFNYLDDDERRFELQKLLLSVIQRRSLGTVRAVEFIREQALRLTTSHKRYGRETERYQPRRRKEILHNLMNEITGSVVMDWTPAELQRIFELASYEEVEVYITHLREAAQFLTGLERILNGILDKKRKMSPAVREVVERVQGLPKVGAAQ
jgi:ParB/RepB/Spo0J family partition protein